MRPASAPDRRLLLWRLAPWVGLLPLLVGATEAWARVGGGQGYSGGSSSGGGYSGGGSGGGGDLVGLLIWLVIRHPTIGIPVLIVVAIAAVIRQRSGAGGWGSVAPEPRTRRAAPSRRVGAGVERLRTLDPNFSEPLFVDHAQLLYATAQELRPRGVVPLLQEHMSESALANLLRGAERLTEVGDVIFGATRISEISFQGTMARIAVVFEANLTEKTGTKSEVLLAEETWVFRRRADALSPGPEGMRALGCASCGSTLEAKVDGTCPNCGGLRRNGQTQWQVEEIRKSQRTPLSPPSLAGGVEAGTQLPTVFHPELAAHKRALIARHPDFDQAAFERRASQIFLKLQEAWSALRWEEARPYETDALFSVHRFWIERYRRFKLVNRLGDVSIDRITLSRVDMDAFYESITIRIGARMKDWMEELGDDGKPTGKVVGGDPRRSRVFSEYWTFLRAVGSTPKKGEADDAAHCPSCGAPLDRVSMAGICGYCDSKITGGDFDWVLSRIEQDEAYVG